MGRGGSETQDWWVCWDLNQFRQSGVRYLRDSFNVCVISDIDIYEKAILKAVSLRIVSSAEGSS